MSLMITIKNAHELVSKQAGILGDIGWFFASGALENKVDQTLAGKLSEALKAQGVNADITVVPTPAAAPAPAQKAVPAPPQALVGADNPDDDAEVPAVRPVATPPKAIRPSGKPGEPDPGGDLLCVTVCVTPIIAPDHLMPPNLKSGKKPEEVPTSGW